jgi:chromosome segregation ATPase
MNDLKDIKDSFLVKNTNNKDAKPIKVETKVIDNPQNLNTNNPSKVIVETKTYCNLVKLGKEGVPINYIGGGPGDKNILPINEISFFLSGGDFLQKKINILEETIMKNSEMYNFVIDKYEKDLKDLKEEMENINKQHKLEIENLTKEKDNTLNQLNNLNSLKNNGQLEIEKLKQEINNHKTKYEELLNTKNILEKESNDYKNKIGSENMKKNNEILELKKKLDEYNIQLNKKGIENEQLKKTIDELKKLKEKEMIDFQKQIKDITFLKDQEIAMLNDRIKEQSDMSDKSLILEKNFENYKINANKINNELMNQNNGLKRQVEEIPVLRQDIEKYKKMYEAIDEENVKIHAEFINLQDKFSAGAKYNHDLSQKIIVLERKLKSDPYFAKEIMSRTLYNFASTIMAENN